MARVSDRRHGQGDDPGEIGALFTDDAQYRWHPWDEGHDVARGRDQIVAAWLENRATSHALRLPHPLGSGTS